MMQYLRQYQDALEQTVMVQENQVLCLSEKINVVLECFRTAKARQSRIFFIGNGGSAAIAQHMTVDYLKNGGMRTHGMHDAAILTCLGNDFGYENVFSKQLELEALVDDIVVAISSSGNSLNIINAVQIAKTKKCKIITLSGFKEDNKLRQMGDCNIYVPSMKYGIVESIHNMILQLIVDLIVEKDGVGLK